MEEGELGRFALNFFPLSLLVVSVTDFFKSLWYDVSMINSISLKAGTIVQGCHSYNKDFIGIIVGQTIEHGYTCYLIQRYGREQPILYKTWEVISNFKEVT